MLKKSLALSFAGHLALFGLFSFSFGVVMPRAGSTQVYFWGQVLPESQLKAVESNYPAQLISSGGLRAQPSLQAPRAQEKVYFKPAEPVAMVTEKQIYSAPLNPVRPAFSRKAAGIILHPFLPYSFPLYFQDRQVAHVELDYSLRANGRNNFVEVSRKISSGNLEVDLLARRYIVRYLYIRQQGLFVNKPQTVKIDLTAKDND